PLGSVSTSFPVSSDITLFVDSPNPPNANPCQAMKGGPGDMYVLAAHGNMSCSIQNNQVWTVSVNYYSISNTVTLYRGSTYVDQFTNNKNSQLSVPVQFSAQSAAATYYLYNGSDSSAE